MIVLQTERLRLRPAKMHDITDVHRFLSDPVAMRFWSTPPHASIDQTERWLQAMIDTTAEEGEDFVVECADRIIGKAGMYRFPEIGFIFEAGYWNQGYATECLQPIIDRAFAYHRLPAIVADVDPDNTASLAVLAKLGFAITGRAECTCLVGDRWTDSVYLRLEAPPLT